MDLTQRDKSLRLLKADHPPVTNTCFLLTNNTYKRDIGRAVDNLQLIVNAAKHGVDLSKFRHGIDGQSLERIELLRLISKKSKATIPQLISVLEQKPTQGQTDLYFDYWSFIIGLFQYADRHISTDIAKVGSIPRTVHCTSGLPGEFATINLYNGWPHAQHHEAEQDT